MQDVKSWVEGWLTSEDAEHDKISVKRIYIDLNDGNIYDALIFSQIMYWHGKSRETGKPRIRIFKDGHYWLAKRYEDWWDECRVEARQAKAAIARIHKRGLIVKTRYQFAGVPTVHIRMDWNAFAASIRHLMSNPIDTRCPMDQTLDVQSYTETTDRDSEQKLLSNRNKGDKAFSEKKPTATFSSDLEQENPETERIDTLSVNRIGHDPLTPSSAAPLSPKNHKIRLTYCDRGIIHFPAQGKHMLAGRFALRSAQVELTAQYMEFGLGRDTEGSYWVCDPYWSEWVQEDEQYTKWTPFTKIVDVLMGDRSPHRLSADSINDLLLEWFEYWSDRLESATLPKGKSFSVLPVVAMIKELGIEEIENDLELCQSF